MRTGILILVPLTSALVFVSLPELVAQQPACSCTGKSSDPVLSGGDQNPLTFSSVRRLQQAGGSGAPVYCYERTVRNHSPNEVRDVDWRVAGYYKSVIKGSSKPICEATSMEGKSDTGKGPLFYSPGKNNYPSSAYAPDGGWPKKQALVVPSGSAPLIAPALTSTIDVPLPDGKVATFELEASVSGRGGEFIYHYGVRHNGSTVLGIMWDIPTYVQLKEVLNPDQGRVLASGQPFTGDIRSGEAPASVLSAFVVLDEGRKVVLSHSIVGAYGAANGPFSSDLRYRLPIGK